MIMTSFHQNQSPPISGERGVGDRGVGESWGGKEGRAWLARPPAGQKEKGGGGKNGFHTRKSIRAGNGVELAATEWSPCF